MRWLADERGLEAWGEATAASEELVLGVVAVLVRRVRGLPDPPLGSGPPGDALDAQVLVGGARLLQSPALLPESPVAQLVSAKCQKRLR